jgi:hypothetical protein
MDYPAVPLQAEPLIAAAISGNPSVRQARPDYVIVDCRQVWSESESTSAERSIDPATLIRIMVQDIPGWKKERIDSKAISVDVIESPKHGTLRTIIEDSGYRFFAYDPAPDFLGRDQIVFTAQVKDKIFRVVATVVTVPSVDDSPDQTVCPYTQIKAAPRKISSSAWPAYTLAEADLPGAALAATSRTGADTSITLDTTAAGHGWFIDSTPDDNSEYLPTADLSVWKAKAGSAADGKMDMLSVLLHEYGHVLGLEHSTDNRDFMAPSLQPGERRLPTTDEVALMSRLASELNDGNAASDAWVSDTATATATATATSDDAIDDRFSAVMFLERYHSAFASRASSGSDTAAALSSALSDADLASLYSSRPSFAAFGFARTSFAALDDRLASYLAVDALPSNFAAIPQYENAVNVTLQNGDFRTDGSQGWITEGSVQIAGDVATLIESASRQTHLAQSFTIRPGDLELSFTLAGRDLMSNGAGCWRCRGWRTIRFRGERRTGAGSARRSEGGSRRGGELAVFRGHGISLCQLEAGEGGCRDTRSSGSAVIKSKDTVCGSMTNRRSRSSVCLSSLSP